MCHVLFAVCHLPLRSPTQISSPSSYCSVSSLSINTLLQLLHQPIHLTALMPLSGRFHCSGNGCVCVTFCAVNPNVIFSPTILSYILIHISEWWPTCTVFVAMSTAIIAHISLSSTGNPSSQRSLHSFWVCKVLNSMYAFYLITSLFSPLWCLEYIHFDHNDSLQPHYQLWCGVCQGLASTWKQWHTCLDPHSCSFHWISSAFWLFLTQPPVSSLNKHPEY